IVPVMLVISLITFILMHATPGGPFDTEKAHSAAVTANLMHKYGLDRPPWQQYLLYVGHAVQGDLGPSYIYQDRNVRDVLLSGLPITARLAGLAMLVALIIGIPLGTISGLKQNT